MGLIGFTIGCFTGEGAADAQRLQELEAKIDALQATVEEQQGEIGRLQVAASGRRGDLVTASELAVATGELSGRIDDLEATTSEVEDLRTRFDTLVTMVRVVDGDLILGNADNDVAKTLPTRATTADVFVIGANLYVANGAGMTGTANGRGNLVLGYDEVGQDFLSATPPPDDDWDDPDDAEDNDNLSVARLGSHNLVIGAYHTYRSFGSILLGYDNYVDAPYSFVGGFRNEAFTDWEPQTSAGDREPAPASYGLLFSGDSSNEGTYNILLGGDSSATRGSNDTLVGGMTSTLPAGAGSRTLLGAIWYQGDPTLPTESTYVGNAGYPLYLSGEEYP